MLASKRSRRIPKYWMWINCKENLDLALTMLAARGIPYELTGKKAHRRIYVPALLVTLARTELLNLKQVQKPLKKYRPLYLPVYQNAHWVMFILLGMVVWHGLRLWWPLNLEGIAHPEHWVDLAALDIYRTWELGEWYRLVTALTLHADSRHLLGNVALSGVFLVLLCRRVGLALGFSLVLLTGISGNFLDVLYRPLHHTSLGFSTALFGSVGALSGYLAVYGHGLRQGFMLIAAAIGILAMLGTGGEQTDVAAHFFGLSSGIVWGGLLGLACKRGLKLSFHPSVWVGIILSAVVLSCIYKALHLT